jgi:hypothetical protein
VSEHADAQAHHGNSKRPPDDPFHRVGKLLLVVRADNKVLSDFLPPPPGRPASRRYEVSPARTTCRARTSAEEASG